MTAALALSAHITDTTAAAGPSTQSGSSAVTDSTTLAGLFDGLLAEVSQELLAEIPELDSTIVQDAQGSNALHLVPDLVADDALLEDEPVSPEPEFSPDSQALLELDDTRHVFMAAVQWPPPAPAVREDAAPPTPDAAAVVDEAPPAVQMPADTDAVVVTQQVTRAVQALPVQRELSIDEPVPEEDVAMDAPVEVDAPVAPKRVDPVQLQTLDSVGLAEPVLVSVDSDTSLEATVPLDASVPVDTPELPVAPVDLDVVRVDIDDDLAVEVRAADGEVDVALLGADAVKPVMKGVQVELRESLKRGGYDLGQFEQSEQEQAERRHRRRQHQQHERRDPRRGTLL